MKFKPGTILTLVSLTITLFLIGIYLILLVHVTKLEDIVNEKTPFVLELRDSLAQPDIFLLKNNLLERSYVIGSSVEYIPKEEGLKMLEDQFGQQILADSTINPLNDVIRFRMHSSYIKSNDVDDLVQELNGLDQVEYCYFEQQQIGLLKGNLSRLNTILLVLGLLFIGISILLIYNNVKLVLRSDRKMLKTMELVGASPSFIKMPYIKKSIQIGFLAGLINLVLFGLLFLYLHYQLDLFAKFFDLTRTLFVLFLIFVIGIFIPLLFSNILINRFVRNTGQMDYE